ncbi:MAG: molybdate ABC transporter substrate-binding protein [Desulfobacterales bacterium]|nr:molybdate ABC transporter substrate-binding protein [Desulfobacterales bacterium]
MKSIFKPVIGVIIILLLFSGLSRAGDCLVYAGAGLKRPMTEMIGSFEADTPHRVDINYGGSGHLFGMMAMGRPCDVFIPGAQRYVDIAVEKGWIDEADVVRLVKHIPAIVVPQNNPSRINSLQDLVKPDVRLALGDPRACAIGNLAEKILKKNGIHERAKTRTRVYGPTVNQLLLYVMTGRVEAAIVWKDLARWPENNGDLQMVEISECRNIIKYIPVAVTLKGRKNPAAESFAAYLASTGGLDLWRKWGFEPCSSLISSN